MTRRTDNFVKDNGNNLCTSMSVISHRHNNKAKLAEWHFPFSSKFIFSDVREAQLWLTIKQILIEPF